ncbi:hypothetical protein [Chitinibacter sp. GC72]|nr:hypothetical protein [Chitinibacter sp. GC72]
MLHTIQTTVIDTTDDFSILNIWHAKGWRITSIRGDEYLASKTVLVPA